MIDLVVLSAIWGASFLFMRIATPEFGPVALVAVRSASAAIFLAPFLLVMGQQVALISHWRAILMLALITTVLPFTLFSYATLYAPAGYVAILNATVPIFTALVAYFWLREQLGVLKVMGLLLGFLGVFVLALDNTSLDTSSGVMPVVAALAGSFCYALGTNFTRVKLAGVSALVIGAGSQVFATLILLPFAIYLWPDVAPGTSSWLSAVVLGVVCTGVALVMFFRLIATVGPTAAVTVAYLIPVFAVVWGLLVLGEVVTTRMFAGGLLTLLGVAVITGVFRKSD